MDDQVRDRTVAWIRAERLDEYERRLGTGHTVVDARIMIGEIRRFRAFLNEVADDFAPSDLSDRLRNAARAVGE